MLWRLLRLEVAVMTNIGSADLNDRALCHILTKGGRKDKKPPACIVSSQIVMTLVEGSGTQFD